MNTFRYCSLVYLASSIALAASAADLTIDECVRIALVQNPELSAHRQRIEAATGLAIQARLWPNPELEISAEDFSPHNGGFSSSQNLIGLSQTIPFPGKKRLDSQIGQKEISAAEWEYLEREIELVRDVKLAFYRVMAAEKRVSVSSEFVDLAKSLSDTARKRMEAGGATDQERLRSEIELERAEVGSIEARRDLLETRKNLGRLLGQPRDALGPLIGELESTAMVAGLDHARELVLGRHPSLRAAMANRDRAALELRRAKLEPWPDATFGVAGGRDEGQNETLMEFRVSIPLPLFDRAQGRRRETRALAEIARYDLTAAEQQLIQEFDVLEARWQAAQEQVDMYRTRILPKSTDAMRLVQQGFEAGKFGFIDLVDTQRTATETRLTYYEKLLELNETQAEFDALLLKDLRSAYPTEEPE